MVWNARFGDGIEEMLNLRRASNEGLAPEFVSRVANEFDEGDE